MEGRREKREVGDGTVELDFRDICVRLMWTKDSKDGSRKKFKDKLLNEFSGKLIVDFRRQGGTFIMNDMVVKMTESINIIDLKEELLSAFDRSNRRGGKVEVISETVFHLFDADTLKGNLTLSFFPDQKKAMAQGNPDTLRDFIRMYSNAINKLSSNTAITSGQVLNASEPWIESQESDPIDENIDVSSDTTPILQDTPTTVGEFDRLCNVDETVLEPIEHVDKSIFGTFQKVVMQELRDMKEDVKSIVLELPTLKELKKSFDALEFQYKSEISDLNAQVLVLGEDAKRFTKHLEKAEKIYRL